MYLLGTLPFFKIHVSHFMAQDDSPYASAISKIHVVGEWPGATLRVFRYFLSLISSLLTGILGGTLSAHFWCLCQKLSLFYTLIKLYYTKALSYQALSLAPDRIPILQRRPRIPASFTAHSNMSLSSLGLFKFGTYGTVHSNSIEHKSLESLWSNRLG